MTIRSDLERLEAEGLLSRTHGGAILKRHMAEEPQYVDNVATHAEEKERIARAAAAMIQPGETVFLSSGTTAARVLRHVSPELEARVVTHNVGALAEAQRPVCASSSSSWAATSGPARMWSTAPRRSSS